MARDHAPAVRQKAQLERKLGRRASYDRILIVSEGSKTEPNYFLEIRKTFRLHATNVEVCHCATGTTPLQVVEYAREVFENGNPHSHIQKRAFEQVYAVFDRDAHASYHQALQQAAGLNGKLRNDNRQPIVFRAIASIPCFELWLLLHYEDIQTPLHRKVVLNRLRQYLPSYAKGQANTFAQTRPYLQEAIARAERLAQRSSPHTGTEPYSAVGELVKTLTSLQK